MSDTISRMTGPDQDGQAPKRCGANTSPRARKDAASRCVRAMLYASLLILISCASTKAANTISLTQYRARVGQATIALDSLSSFDEGVSERQRAARIASTLREVRKALPPTLAVEWNGAPAAFNNSWLDDALKEYEKLPPSDALRRDEALRSITERLHALGERLDEALGKTSGARNKTEEKARLTSILRRSEYNRATEESAVARLWARIKRWLRSLLPRRRAVAVEPGHRTPVATNLAEFIVIALALAAIAYAAWKLAPRFLRNRGARKRDKSKARVVLGEHLAPDQTASDILAEAEKLARMGDIRGAIRKGYIALLCELGDRRILSLAQHKTNRDYLRALADKRPLYSRVEQLTDTFENHWYGYAPGTENDWATFRVHYQKAVASDE